MENLKLLVAAALVQEAFVALTIFERLAAADAVTVSLLARLSQYFSQVRNQPNLSFDPDSL